jgi:hypothetical protein
MASQPFAQHFDCVTITPLICVLSEHSVVPEGHALPEPEPSARTIVAATVKAAVALSTADLTNTNFSIGFPQRGTPASSVACQSIWRTFLTR